MVGCMCACVRLCVEVRACLQAPRPPHTCARRDESVLRRAAVRLVQKQANIDLSPCQHWLRFADIHYRRPARSAAKPDSHDVVTVFCVLVHDLPPPPEEPAAQAKKVCVRVMYACARVCMCAPALWGCDALCARFEGC